MLEHADTGFVLIFTFFTSLIGLLTVFGLFFSIKKVSVNHAKASSIATAIRQGAMTFLKEEYSIILFMVVLIAFFLSYIFGTILAGMAFVCGAISSMLTGFIGMRAATLANIRTTMQARDKDEHAAFLMAFFGGGVMGFAVASFGLFCLGALFYFFMGHADFVIILTSFGLGCSLVAFFARVGGGIFTKSADVGADLVGKLKQVFLKMIQEILLLLQIMLVIVLVILQAWVLIFMSHILERWFLQLF